MLENPLARFGCIEDQGLDSAGECFPGSGIHCHMDICHFGQSLVDSGGSVVCNGQSLA